MILRPAILTLAAAMTIASAMPVQAQRSEQDKVYEETQRGTIRPLGEIIDNVRRQVGGSFLGSDFDPDSRRYRLKYMREGSVVIVNVDARTGNVLSMTGN